MIGGGHQSGNVYATSGVSQTIMAGTHGYGIGYILVKVKGNEADKE